MKNIKLYVLLILIGSMIIMFSCKKHDDIIPDSTTNTIKIDSIIPTKHNLVVWEESYVTVYAKGENLSYKWEADHGSMLGKDSITVVYWGCPSCLGTNTIKCTVSNSYGSVSDTVMVHVTE